MDLHYLKCGNCNFRGGLTIKQLKQQVFKYDVTVTCVSLASDRLGRAEAELLVFREVLLLEHVPAVLLVSRCRGIPEAVEHVLAVPWES